MFFYQILALGYPKKESRGARGERRGMDYKQNPLPLLAALNQILGELGALGEINQECWKITLAEHAESAEE